MSARPAKGARSDQREDFDRVFAELRGILAPYAPKLRVMRDKPGDYYLETRGPGPRKVPLMFAAVKTNKHYVSFHLMPIYVAAMEMSPALKKRMQGKACFNFTVVDQPLIEELAALTERGYDGWKKLEWVD